MLYLIFEPAQGTASDNFPQEAQISKSWKCWFEKIHGLLISWQAN